jgi:hypothetical protein
LQQAARLKGRRVKADHAVAIQILLKHPLDHELVAVTLLSKFQLKLPLLLVHTVPISVDVFFQATS